MTPCTAYDELAPPSDWVLHWGSTIGSRRSVLDVACGNGRHCRWFAEQGHTVTGIDHDAQALGSAARWAHVVHADLEAAAWPLLDETSGQPKSFDVVIVTNYLWRPLLPNILRSVAPGGCLIYETFAVGNEKLGRPKNPAFLLHEGELLAICDKWRVVAYEHRELTEPRRLVQRIFAYRTDVASRSSG